MCTSCAKTSPQFNLPTRLAERRASFCRSNSIFGCLPNAAPTELASRRDNLLDAARRAVALDPHYRKRLASLARPAPQSEDDDLKNFADDKEFLAILGKHAP